MIHLFVLQNWSSILVHEGKWKMSISFKGRYLYSVLLVFKGFFFFLILCHRIIWKPVVLSLSHCQILLLYFGW